MELDIEQWERSMAREDEYFSGLLHQMIRFEMKQTPRFI